MTVARAAPSLFAVAVEHPCVSAVVAEKVSKMPKENAPRDNLDRHWLSVHLAEETGVTVAQAKDLIFLLGTDWPTLVREARFLKTRN